MPDVRSVAASYGVRVELADLGDWATVTLVAEYDPDGPVIRVNERALSKGDARRDAIDHAIAHELYHHREAIGEIPHIADRIARELAADAFAGALVRAR
ncbi:MAG: ImmA/IrrE family metallo-endopeptidase [Candidatus Eremiobacteraeota bacterium]|nr:ImmA/IrrE family metallo-endopeptidase [Candidatus Eremiobacteraeota bacterium]